MTTPDDNMEVVEIVARALWEKDYPPRARNISDWNQLAPGTQRIWASRAKAALTAIEASGWKIVPVEYTPGMFVAGDQQYDEGYGVPEIYRAMLSASPKVTR